MNDLVPRNKLVKFGTQGTIGIAGAVAVFILSGLSSTPIGLVIGAVLAFVGIGVSRSKEDRLFGIMTAIAGGLTFTASTGIVLLSGLAKGLLLFSGVGLLAAGAFGLIKFFSGMKKNRKG